MKLVTRFGAFLLLPFVFSAAFAATNNPIAKEDAVLAADSSFNSAHTPPSFKTYMEDIHFKNPTGYWHLVTSPVLPTPMPQEQMGPGYMPRDGYESLTLKQWYQLDRRVTGW